MKTRINIPEGEDNQAVTRRQLIEAAGAVFAEVGFRSATVREICRRGEANIAAVNYHFGDKETLYLEVLRYANARALEKYPPFLNVGPEAPAEKRLRAYVLSFLLRIFDQGPTSWYGKLMSREMIEPTAALESIIEEKIRPMSKDLWTIVAELLDCPLNDGRVRQCSFSVVSQCVFYHHCRPVMTRMHPELASLDAAGIESLADHITRFSLAAIKAIAARK